MLKAVAQRLLGGVRSSDTVSRYGGDEFVLLLPDVEDKKRALDVAGKIRDRLAKPYRVDDHSITVTASIGVAVTAGDGVSQQDLLKQADVAMYFAKTVQGPATAHPRIALAPGA